jgi:hypothetical protein
MKDYYQILRVRRGAGSPEIKRAYRVLVQQLHPDVNPDPAAHESIKEVNEAYDVLSDDAKKREYDYQLANPGAAVHVPEEPVHRDPYFGRKERYVHNPEKSERIKMMEKTLSFFRWVFRAAAVFCLVLLLDFLIPRATSTEQVEGIYKIRTRSRTRSGSTYHTGNMVVTNTGRSFIIEIDETKFFEADPIVLVYESRILSITTKIQTQSKSFTFTNFASVYNNFFFLPILIGIGAAIGLTVKKATLDFNFSLGLVILILFGITIKLML